MSKTDYRHQRDFIAILYRGRFIAEPEFKPFISLHLCASFPVILLTIFQFLYQANILRLLSAVFYCLQHFSITFAVSENSRVRTICFLLLWDQILQRPFWVLQ